MDQTRRIGVLRSIAERLRGADVVWSLTGSTSFWLQGVPVEPHDIDLQTDMDGAYRIQQRLWEFVVCPVRFSTAATIRSHLGTFSMDGIAVEVMGAIQKRLPDGTWEDPVDPRAHRRFIQLDELWLPVLSLTYEAAAYRTLGRHDRADLLTHWLAQHRHIGS
jgi:hypothetical protein